MNESSNSTKSNQNASILDVIKGLVIVAALLFLAILCITFLVNHTSSALLAFFDKLSTLDAAIVVALITGCVSIFTVVVGAIINNILSSRHKHQEYLRVHREEPYTKLISIYFKVLQASKESGKPYSEKELLKDMMEFSQGLTLWGSSTAIKKWDKWRLMSLNSNADSKDVMHGMEDVLLQLRKDMGEKRGLKQGDLLKMFVNDYDEAMSG